MGTHTQALLDPLSTTRTLLASELRFHPDHRKLLHLPIVSHPVQKVAPGGVMHALDQMTVLDKMADLQGFIGKHVVRRDERVRRLPDEASPEGDSVHPSSGEGGNVPSDSVCTVRRSDMIQSPSTVRAGVVRPSIV